jgi:lysozyme
MIPSDKCSNLIKSFEQCRLTAYLPTPKDHPTIGWGTTGPDVRMGMVWTQARADGRFSRDLNDFATGVTHELGNAPTTQDQFDALVSFAYNVGVKALDSSTLLKKHKSGDYAGATLEFLKWNKQAGVVLNGLTRRRTAEMNLYKGLV